ncbi:MAG: hypothetical protein FIA94_13545 [Nitrospirae bacterium]|nr:hypothetical protein [Nitrospirota bacterium]
MAYGEKIVLRFLDGTILKGYLEGFSEEASIVTVRAAAMDRAVEVDVDNLKAIFFVKTFEGNSRYNEKKSYGIRKPQGNRTYVKFNDGEDMVGFITGEVPWDKGFFLSGHKGKVKGFYLLPTDKGSNNIRVFVYTSAIRDITVVP